MQSEVKQQSLRIAFGVHREPVEAPRKLVLACLQHDDMATATALAVAMKAGGRKLAYVAAHTGLSESYVSLLRSGKRRIGEALVDRLCAATGSTLLRQVWEAQAAMDADDERREIERLADMLRKAA